MEQRSAQHRLWDVRPSVAAVKLAAGLGLVFGAAACQAPAVPTEPATGASTSTEAPTTGTESSQAPIEAKLVVSARPHEPHWVETDASGTLDPAGRVVSYTFQVTDKASDKVVRGPVTSDRPRHGFALGPGEYEVELRVTDVEGAESTALAGLSVPADQVVLSKRGTPCSL